MAKDPAFLFYSNDFLSGTFTMTDEQVGKYIRLLCIQHQKGQLLQKDMLNICKTYDEDVYSKFKEENGVYYNVRLREESEKRKAYSESRRKNKLSVKSEKTYVEHMENENENINVTNNIINIPFETFWNEYDKKVGDKSKLNKKWDKLSNEDRTAIIGYIPHYKLSQPEKKYRKNPETFLNNKSWNDELIGTQSETGNINRTNGLPPVLGKKYKTADLQNPWGWLT